MALVLRVELCTWAKQIETLRNIKHRGGVDSDFISWPLFLIDHCCLPSWCYLCAGKNRFSSTTAVLRSRGLPPRAVFFYYGFQDQTQVTRLAGQALLPPEPSHQLHFIVFTLPVKLAKKSESQRSFSVPVGGNPAISVFEAICEMNYIYWFLYADPSLNLWGEVNLIRMNDVFDKILNSVG